MDNKDVVYGIYVMEYCSVIKILSFVTTQIDLENIMLSEISQTEKDNFFMISHMWNVNKTNAKLIDVENIFVVASGRD